MRIPGLVIVSCWARLLIRRVSSLVVSVTLVISWRWDISRPLWAVSGSLRTGTGAVRGPGLVGLVGSDGGSRVGAAVRVRISMISVVLVWMWWVSWIMSVIGLWAIGVFLALISLLPLRWSLARLLGIL
ncbi:hypothetical protein ABW19_dt0209853 [Dactylella cylindrospora]|nr:hypothetical protein ABW19_dt0209853 [Dactylella cylindrospora]